MEQLESLKDKFPSLFTTTESHFFSTIKVKKDVKELENLEDQKDLSVEKYLEQSFIYQKTPQKVYKSDKKEKKKEIEKIDLFDLVEDESSETKEPLNHHEKRNLLRRQKYLERVRVQEENKQKKEDSKRKRKRDEEEKKEKKRKKDQENQQKKSKTDLPPIPKKSSENVVFKEIKLDEIFQGEIQNITGQSKITSTLFRTLITQISQHKIKYKSLNHPKLSTIPVYLDQIQSLLESDEIQSKKVEIIKTSNQIISTTIYYLYGVKDINIHTMEKLPNLLTPQLFHFFNIIKRNNMNDIDLYSIIVILLKLVNQCYNSK